MHCHLVAVEVRIKGGAYQGVDSYCLTLDKDRLEGLNTEAVQCGRTIKKDGVLVNDLVEDIPYLRLLALDHLLCALHRLDVATVDELADDEGLKQFDGHLFRQAAFVEFEFGPYHDDGASGVVDTLAEQVLAEASLLALQHVTEAFERPSCTTSDGSASTAVVKEGIYRLLKHPFFVSQDDLRSTDFHKLLEAVVSDYDATVEVIKVACGEPSSLERDKWPEFRGDDRYYAKDHPFRLVGFFCLLRLEGLYHPKALERLAFALNGSLRLNGVLKCRHKRWNIDISQNLPESLASGGGHERFLFLVLRPKLFENVEILLLRQEVHDLQF